MTSNIINAIFFDIGRTLRLTIKDSEKQEYWLNKIISLTGLNWTTKEMAYRLTEIESCCI